MRQEALRGGSLRIANNGELWLECNYVQLCIARYRFCCGLRLNGRTSGESTCNPPLFVVSRPPYQGVLGPPRQFRPSSAPQAGCSQRRQAGASVHRGLGVHLGHGGNHIK